VIRLKKAVLASFIILCLLFVFFLKVYKISVKASAGTIYVPADYPTIQEAIDNANEGDTVFVYNRTYYERIVVNKSISLVGENRDFTIIDANGTGSGISIRANKVRVTGFTIKESGYLESGIYVEPCRDNVISRNKITNNYEGISLRFSSSNMFSDNIISNNIYGITAYSSADNRFSDNDISYNDYGITAYSSADNRFSDNDISYNDYFGIYLYSSSNNMFLNNIISNNNEGIYLYFSSNNIFSGNIISGNTCGISLLLLSHNNMIYHNNFNNTDQVLSDSKNDWDYGGEGNFWSNYKERYPNATEIDGSGIWDTPYVIDENNRDDYPLMGMFSDFSIVHREETYHVTVICNSTASNFRFEIGAETGNKMIRFNVTGEAGTVGSCRITIPTMLMNYSFIVLFDDKEITPTPLNISNETYAYLHFTYTHSSHTITVISSKTLLLYSELLVKYDKLKVDLNNLNATYYDLLINYSVLLNNYTTLQESYQRLNNSYREYLLNYSKNMQNIQSLMYIFAATTAIFLITTTYLSKRAHARMTTSTKSMEER